MKIAVCVKHVPKRTIHLDPASRRVDRSAEGMLNSADAKAVEEALRITEQQGAGEVVVVSLGPEGAVDSVRSALAMGADRAVVVSDPAAVGSDLVATSYVLALALSREHPDLILLGQQGLDSDGAVLGAAVAERLQLPVITQAAELTIDGSTVRGKRQTEAGYDTLEVPLPAVVAVSDAIAEPRYTSFKGIVAAKRKPQDVVDLAGLGADPTLAGEAGSRTMVLALGAPPPHGDQRIVEEVDGAAELIVEFLKEMRLL